MISIRAILLLIGLLCATVAHSGPVYHYTIGIDPQLKMLKVRACFDGALPRALVPGSPHAPVFIEMNGVEDDPKGLPLNKLARDGCINYRVDVASIAVLNQLPLGVRIGGDLMIPREIWLWRPKNIKANIDLHFDLPPGINVSAPWYPLANGDYRIGHTPAHWPAAVAFGRFEERRIKVPGAVLRLAVLDTKPPADVDAIETWVEDAARAVVGLYGRFPVETAQVLIIPKREGDGPYPMERSCAAAEAPCDSLSINDICSRISSSTEPRPTNSRI